MEVEDDYHLGDFCLEGSDIIRFISDQTGKPEDEIGEDTTLDDLCIDQGSDPNSACIGSYGDDLTLLFSRIEDFCGVYIGNPVHGTVRNVRDLVNHVVSAYDSSLFSFGSR